MKARPWSLRLFSINSDAVSCGRAPHALPDCKIDWARKIHRTAHDCSTLLNSEETAIAGATKFTRIQSAPRIRIVGESAGGRLRQHYRHRNKRRHNLGFKAHRQASWLLLKMAARRGSVRHASLTLGSLKSAFL